MKKILLVCGPGRHSTEALHWSLHQSKETGSPIKVIYASSGESPEAGRVFLEETKKQFSSFQVPGETEGVEGAYFDICCKTALEPNVGVLVMIEKKQSFLKKMFDGSEGNQLKDHALCELKVYRAT